MVGWRQAALNKVVVALATEYRKHPFAAPDQIVEQAVEPGGELQPQPDLEKRNQSMEPIDNGSRLGDVRYVERDDQPIFDPLGNVTGTRPHTGHS